MSCNRPVAKTLALYYSLINEHFLHTCLIKYHTVRFQSFSPVGDGEIYILTKSSL